MLFLNASYLDALLATVAGQFHSCTVLKLNKLVVTKCMRVYYGLFLVNGEPALVLAKHVTEAE